MQILQFQPFCVCLQTSDLPTLVMVHAIRLIKRFIILTLSDSEHLGTTYGTHTLSCRFAILESYGSGVFHFPFGTAFHTVGLHFTPPFRYDDASRGI